MLEFFYKVKGGIQIKAHGDFYFFMDNVADRCIKNEGQVLGLTYKGADQKADLELYRQAKSDGATATLEIIDKNMRYKYKVNAGDIEKEINKTGNPELAALLGWTLANYGGSHNKVPIAVSNDVIIGLILYVLLAVEGAHSYNIECTQIGENGKDDIITLRNTTFASGTLDGFISGAKYRFRAQGVLGNALFSEFTGYVELRIN